MSVTIVYRAQSVGPICARIAATDDRIRTVHESQLTPADVAPARLIHQPAPPDPLLALWDEASTMAEDFADMELTRADVARMGIAELIGRLQMVQVGMATPAPIAPPPLPTERNVLVRWGSRWRGMADVTINTSDAVNTARNKKESRIRLAGLCPTTFYRSYDVRTPCVVRPRIHHGGNRFFVCRDQAEVKRAITRCGPGWYASELINKANEYRVFVFQGRVIRISEKLPNRNDRDAVAWNLAAGGGSKTLKKKEWPVPVALAAIKAAYRLGLDWTAVDVAIDNQGRVVVFEANTAPGLKNPRTIEQIGWAFTSAIETPTLFALVNPTTWQELIHPSLREE